MGEQDCIPGSWLQQFTLYYGKHVVCEAVDEGPLSYSFSTPSLRVSAVQIKNEQTNR